MTVKAVKKAVKGGKMAIKNNSYTHFQRKGCFVKASISLLLRKLVVAGAVVVGGVTGAWAQTYGVTVDFGANATATIANCGQGNDGNLATGTKVQCGDTRRPSVTITPDAGFYLEATTGSTFGLWDPVDIPTNKKSGEAQVLRLAPELGVHGADVTLNITSHIKANPQITVNFGGNATATIANCATASNGDLASGTAVSCDIDTEPTVTITPKTGYYLEANSAGAYSDWTPDYIATDVAAGTGKGFTLADDLVTDKIFDIAAQVVSGYTVTVTFGSNATATISGCKSGGGSQPLLTSGTAVLCDVGETPVVRITPNPDYKLYAGSGFANWNPATIASDIENPDYQDFTAATTLSGNLTLDVASRIVSTIPPTGLPDLTTATTWMLVLLALSLGLWGYVGRSYVVSRRKS